MAKEICQIAVSAFAESGIALAPVTERDYCWTHDCFLISEPPRKDIEVRIHKTHYMGPIVYRITVPDVHFEDAYAVAEKVLADYLSTHKHSNVNSPTGEHDIVGDYDTPETSYQVKGEGITAFKQHAS